ncbi:MAG TPA: permease [Verrucomicrobiae bacterium]|nr:permease [Verrucomicrobiae bacterium]
MPSVFLLAATLAALAAGPFLYGAARRSPAALAFLDGFVLVSIAGLVILEVVPGTFMEGGPWSLAFLLVGLFGPTLLERAFRHAERQAHMVALGLAICGLVLHALADGLVLAPAVDGDWALPLAVVVHSLPVGMAVWWLLAPSFGPWPPTLALAAMGVGTVAGYHYGVSLGALLSEQGWAWFQSLVAGTLLHVIFGRPHLHGDEDPHHAHVEHTPAAVARFEGLGNLVALVALAIIGLMHGASAPSAVALRFVDLALESAPALLLAYVIGGFVAGELPAGLLRWVSAGGRASQALRGTALGLPLPICSCSALPLYRSLSQRGVAPAAALAFLIAAPEVGLTALLVSLPLLGWEMTLVRVGAAAVLAVVVGYVVAGWAQTTFRFAAAAAAPNLIPASTLACDSHDHDHGDGHDDPHAHAHTQAHPNAPTPRSRLGAALRAGMIDLVDGTAPWIIVGLLVAAAAEPLLTQVLWASWPDVLEVFVFALVGMPIFVCAAGATPLVAVLIAAGVSPGAALAFLLTGPATNVSTFGVLRQLHGGRMAWVFAVVTAIGATALGVGVNLLPLSSVPAAGAATETHGWIEQTSLALLALLYLASLLRRGARAFIGELADTGVPAPAHAGH